MPSAPLMLLTCGIALVTARVITEAAWPLGAAGLTLVAAAGILDELRRD